MTSTAEPNSSLVSVCVPTHNDGAYFAESLRSIVGQTYEHLEILVGDDASTDDTEAIVRSMNDPRILYRRNATNLGQFANVNELVCRARGKYVAIYHADDVYEPDIVCKEVEFLQRYLDVGAVFALDRLIDHNGRVFASRAMPKEIALRAGLDFPEVMRFLLRYKNVLLCAPSFMGRAEMLRRAGPFDTTEYSIASDLEMWIRILTVSRVAVLDEYLMRYRRSPTQLSSGYNYLRTFPDHFFAILDRYLELLNQTEPADAISLTEYAFHRCDDYTFRAANHVILGNARAARELLAFPFPWKTFFFNFRRRKLRVLLLRLLLMAGLASGTWPLLRGLLLRTEYPGPTFRGAPKPVMAGSNFNGGTGQNR